MAETLDVSEFAASVLHLIQRFMGDQPNALAQMRIQVENELAGGRQIVARAEAQLAAIDRIEAAIAQAEEPTQATSISLVSPPLKKAILRILYEDPGRVWRRDELYAELVRRGWGPGGTNPRNTFTSRLRDLEKEGKVRREGAQGFTWPKDEEVLVM